MTDWVLSLVPVWGVWLVAAATFLSCLALPVPASFVMLAAGGFAAAGDLAVWQAAGAALIGAVAGDHLGYAIGRSAGAAVLDRLTRSSRRRAAVERATAYVRDKGGMAVFLSRWLLSPLGPYVNLASGAAGLGWRRFARADVAGEALWVAIYTGLGFAFAGQIVALGQLLGSASGALAAGAVAGILGWRLVAVLKHGKKHRSRA